VGLSLYRYIHDAYGALQHMHEEQGKMILVQTRLKNKKISPILCWWYTFDEMQNDVRKKYERTKIKTSEEERM
jgi:hypothetical protein